MTPDERAKRSAEVMWADDNASNWFGMQIDEVTEGRAILSMTVEKQHCNGLAICHGGVTFSLADSAFALACNSRNQATVAQHNSINYIAPGHQGDRLTAIAEERLLSGRSGIYDVTVTNQNGKVIAEFRGLSRSIKGQLFEENEASGEKT